MKQKFYYSVWVKAIAVLLCLASVFAASFVTIENGYLQNGDYYMTYSYHHGEPYPQITRILDHSRMAFVSYVDGLVEEEQTIQTEHGEISEDEIRHARVENGGMYYYSEEEGSDSEKAETAPPAGAEPGAAESLPATGLPTELPEEPAIRTVRRIDQTPEEWNRSIDSLAWSHDEMAGNESRLLDALAHYPIEYYYVANGAVVTNASKTDVLYFSSSPASVEWVDRSGQNLIRIRVTDDYYNWYTAHMEESREAFVTTVSWLIGLGILFCLALLYLVLVSGHRPEDDAIYQNPLDRLWVDVSLLLMLGIFIFSVVFYLESISYFDSSSLSALLLSLFAAAAAGFLLALGLSVVRNLKGGTFLRRTFLGALIAHYTKKGQHEKAEALRAVGQKYTRPLSGSGGKKAVLGILAFTVILFIFRSLMRHSLWAFLLFIAFLFVVIYLSAVAMNGISEIRRAIFEIRNGNTQYRIEGAFPGVIGRAADAVNHIGEGFTAAVEEQVRATRLKSELITNVSHDLKTPLTSIVSYTDLLANMKLTPNEANDYVAILGQKTQRLQKLTADLFDISKVESGNEDVKCEELDLSLLTKQALAELDAEIKASDLTFSLQISENAYAMGDGKKLSRVLENLLVNALKYSLPGTRVHVNVTRGEQSHRIEIKNIAKDPMDFTGGEITERFVRGEKSRTTEGSGLGLAIAKSYTEAMGGAFHVTVDGDLFKATVTLPAIQ